MNKETFGAFVAAARKERDMTQQNLADRLHVTDKAVSKWERGLCYPDLTLMEELAAALNLTVAELITCQRQPEPEKEDAALHALLDISDHALKRQRKVVWIKALAVITVFLVLAACVLYGSVITSETVRKTVFMKETDGAEHFLYLDDGGRLLRLQCPEEIYDSVAAGDLSEYSITYTWNRLARTGVVKACVPEAAQVLLGGVMDQVGASTDFGSALGVPCVWMEFRNIYPDPDRPGKYLFTYRLWYSGDGSDYFAPGEETNLVIVSDCRSFCADDYDGDGAAEVFVLTRYDERPYLLIDTENGAVTQEFVTAVPEQVAEAFLRDTAGN